MRLEGSRSSEHGDFVLAVRLVDLKVDGLESVLRDCFEIAILKGAPVLKKLRRTTYSHELHEVDQIVGRVVIFFARH